MKRKTPWLDRQKNGTGLDAPTWKGGTRREWNEKQHQHGDHQIKPTLLSNIKRQLGLPPAHSFVTQGIPGTKRAG